MFSKLIAPAKTTGLPINGISPSMLPPPGAITHSGPHSHLFMKLVYPLPPARLRPAMQLPVLYSAPHNDIVVHRGSHACPARNPHDHLGIVCDACQFSIIGSRYMCINCEDWVPNTFIFHVQSPTMPQDLCEKCEAEGGKHNPNHVFLKVSLASLCSFR